jgi:Restriction endonuclease
MYSLHISQNKFEQIANVILAPTKSYYSSFPEFTPLEFEHFTIFLLHTLGYVILSSNDNIVADGGVDFVAQKENKIIIGQCKKSDWSSKIIGGTQSNISEPTIKQHFATVALNKTKYPNNELIGYFVTLQRFSLPCKTTFAKEPSIKLFDCKALKNLSL